MFPVMRAIMWAAALLAAACHARRVRMLSDNAQHRLCEEHLCSPDAAQKRLQRLPLFDQRQSQSTRQLRVSDALRSCATILLGVSPLAGWQVAGAGHACHGHGFARNDLPVKTQRPCPLVAAPGRAALQMNQLLSEEMLAELQGTLGQGDEERIPEEEQGMQAPEAVGLAVGIDLGTTTSAIAVVADDKPYVVHKLNSVVRPIDPDNPLHEPVVGEVASDTPGTIFSAKRLMGQTYQEVEATLPKHCELRSALRPLPQQDGTKGAGLRSSFSKEVFSPEWVGSQVLKELLDRCEEATGVRAEKAVIGVPAYFSPDQQDATRRAAELAGLAKVKLIREPIAAALAYDVLAGSARGVKDELVCVYDLGGGTLDVSILQMGGGTAEVLSGAGDNWLGGDDFDAVMASLLARKAGWPESTASMPALVKLARAVKEKLSSVNKIAVELPARAEHGASVAGEPITLEVSRKDMCRACSTMIKNMKVAMVHAAEQSRIPLRSVKKHDGGSVPAIAARPSTNGRMIDRVLLVGAASCMPFIAEFLEEMTGIKPSLNKVEPVSAVALGAAVQAAMLSGELARYDVMSGLEAAYIRGMARGQMSQRQWKKMTQEASDERFKGEKRGKSRTNKMKTWQKNKKRVVG